MTLIIIALIGIIPATIAAIASIRTNRNQKTNHGKNIGQHVEALGDKLERIEATMVTQADLAAHAEHDLRVAAKLDRGQREILAEVKIQGNQTFS